MPARPIRILFIVLILVISMMSEAHSQIGNVSKQTLIDITKEWQGERFVDGRPKVSDDILERMQKVAIEEAWSVLRKHGYEYQFDGELTNVHPERILVGRAVTATFVPTRPDIKNYITEWGESTNRVGKGASNSWVIDSLVENDVMVIDMFGKVIEGTFTGGNLANATKSNGANGMVIYGGVRDIDDTYDLDDFNFFILGYDPSGWRRSADLVTMNGPTRIGRVTVIPGDVVLGRRGGLIFIPAHLAEEVVKTSEVTRLRDDFGYERMAQGKYTPGQIDMKWTEEIMNDFLVWINDYLNEVYSSKAEIKRYLETGRWE